MSSSIRDAAVVSGDGGNGRCAPAIDTSSTEKF